MGVQHKTASGKGIEMEAFVDTIMNLDFILEQQETNSELLLGRTCGFVCIENGWKGLNRNSHKTIPGI